MDLFWTAVTIVVIAVGVGLSYLVSRAMRGQQQPEQSWQRFRDEAETRIRNQPWWL